MNNRSIIRAAYIQNNHNLNMKSINKHNDSIYDYSGLFIDDEELLFNPGNFVQLSEMINKIYFDKNFRDIKFNNLYNKISPYRSISNQANILKNYI